MWLLQLLQARVYQLQTVDGRPLGKVLKVNRGDIGSQMLNNNQASEGEVVWAAAFELCLVPACAPATGWFGDFGGREVVGLLLGPWVRADPSACPCPLCTGLGGHGQRGGSACSTVLGRCACHEQNRCCTCAAAWPWLVLRRG